MRKFQRDIVASFAIASLLLATGCAAENSTQNTPTTNVNDVTISNENVTDASVLLTPVTDIEENKKDIRGSFSIVTEDGAVKEENNVYTITSAGTYTLSGRLEEGQILVDAPEDAKVELVLNGAYIASTTGSPICAIQAKDLKVKAAENTYNEVYDLRTEKKDEEETTTEEVSQNAAIYATCDLSIVGKGALNVVANYYNGIQTKDDLEVKNVSLKVKAVHHALRGKDSVTVTSGELCLETTKGDGINSEEMVQIDDGAIEISAGDDGMHADKELTVNGGSVHVTKSYEGLEAVTVTIQNGTVVIFATDDGINATTDETRTVTPSVIINGGVVDVTTPSGDTDAVDSNGNFVMNGGYALIKGGAAMGNMAGSVDVDGTVTVNGGTIIAVGGICETPGNGINGYAMSGTALPAGSYVVTNASGETVTSFTLDSTYSGFWIASDALATDETYLLATETSTVFSWTQTEGMMGSTGMGPGGPGNFGGNQGGNPGGFGGNPGGFGGNQDGFGGNGGGFGGPGGNRGDGNFPGGAPNGNNGNHK